MSFEDPVGDPRSESGGAKPRPWTTGELATLRELAASGIGLAEVAVGLDRSERSVKGQAVRQRISLRRTGERRGSILGELAGHRLPTEIRTAVFIGFSDPVSAEQRSRRSGELCPGCAARYVSTRSGFCDPCHLKRLAEGHREELAVAAGRRELDAARALKYRARRSTR